MKLQTPLNTVLLSAALLTLAGCNNNRTTDGSTSTSTPATPAYQHPTHSSPIALSIDNQLVWTVNPDSDTVSVMRTDNNTIVGTINVGDEPRSITLSPDNKLAYVANAADNGISVISITDATPTGFSAELSTSLTTGAEPNGVVFSPDGKRVFVTNANQDTVSVINSEDHQLIGSIDLKNSLCNVGDTQRHFHPRAMAVTQDNSTLYVTRFLSFTHDNGVQKDDFGKKGVV